MRGRLGRLVCILVVTLALPAALAPAAGAQSDGSAAQLPPEAFLTAPPEVRLVAQDGFGDPRNGYAWSMARFRGRIYVGTGRQIACVENATVDFFLRVSDRYVTNPLPGATCPPDPYDMDLRAEIWEYTPRTGRWRRVYRSRADVPNPRAPGKFVARDIAFRGMTVFRDARGRKRLYVGGVTADEYLPELKRKYPPRILSSRDGRHWLATPARDVVVRVPYGVFRPMGFRSLRVWRGRMYVTVTPGLTGDGAIFEVKRPWSPRARALPADHAEHHRGVRVRQLQPRALRRHGRPRARLRRVPDHPQALAVPLGADRHGRRRPRAHGDVRRLHARLQGPALRRVQRLVQRGGEPGLGDHPDRPRRPLAGGDRAASHREAASLVGPISGLGDGFNNVFSAHFWRMASNRGEIVVGTNDWAYLSVLAYPGLAPQEVDLVEFVLKGEMGFDLWASCDGVNWRAVTRDAFGGNRYDFGARNLVPADGGLYVGSANHAQGAEGVDLPLERLLGQGATAAAAGAQGTRSPIPQALMTDVQEKGTVLSWRPGAAPAGTRYRIMRAAYTDVPLGLAPPEVTANGFPLEGALPRVGAPGANGAGTADLPLRKGFSSIGTTQDRFFVDRTARPGARYAYQVVAEPPSGARSAPSNVQVVPDPRPAPDLAAAGARGAAASMSRVAEDAAARRATLRRLARLRRAAPPGSDRRLLLDRLERRVRYAGIAEGR